MRRFATASLAGALLLLAPLATHAAGTDPLAPPPGGQPQPVVPPPSNPPPPAPPAVEPPPPPMGNQKEAGVAVELHLGSSVLSLAGGGGANISISTVQGGFFVGYKIGRIIAGIGLDILRTASGSSSSTQTDQSRADTSVLVIPGVRIAILRSSDQRVELFGQLDIGLGGSINSTNPAPPPPVPDTSNFHFMYQVGPGLRYWVAPQFAFGGLVALHGDFTTNSTSMMTMAGTTTQSNSTGVTSILAAIQLLGVF